MKNQPEKMLFSWHNDNGVKNGGLQFGRVLQSGEK
jgi:hypothetical protein